MTDWADEIAENLGLDKHVSPAFHGVAAALRAERARNEARIRELEDGLRDAILCVESWAGYASDYFREKHDLKGDIARLRAMIEAATREETKP